MAEMNISDSNQAAEIQRELERLMFLDFVQKAAQHAVPYVPKAYNNVKENSGPLKPTVEEVEDTVKTVVSPASDTVHEDPVEALQFADRKDEESVTEEKSSNVAAEIKEVGVVETAADHYKVLNDESVTEEKSGSVAADVKDVGVVETAAGLTESAYAEVETTAKEVSEKYEPVVEQQHAAAASSWYSRNVSLFSTVAKVVKPTASYVSEKYNQTVKKTAEEGYHVSSYLPLVPTEKIGKVFSTTELEAEGKKEPMVHSEAGR